LEREILYKYRALNGVNKNRVERIFTHDELFFPNPMQFNDPFDCKVELSLEASEEELNQYVKKIVDKNIFKNNPSEKFRLRQRLMHNIRKGKLDSKISHQISAKLGIYSLSKVPDDILMWSHYADSHRGICIGFYAGPYDHFFRISQEVIYRTDYPTTAIHHSDDERMKATVLTKSDHWSYEKEYRIIDYKTGAGIKKYPNNLLACVILGIEISNDDKKDVISWSQNHSAKPQIFQAVRAERQFAVELERLN
jgi:hypothetical protein